MERFIFAVFILGLNGAYWHNYYNKLKELSSEGAFGMSIVGIIILGVSIMLLLNINIIL